MTCRVFHPGAPLVAGSVVELPPDEAHYLARVRRAGPGDAVEVLDGAGGHVLAEIVSVAGSTCRLRLGDPVPAPRVPPVVLLLGLPDARAALDALTAASELGASTVVLVRCTRSQGGAPSPGRIDKVLRASQRQCGRPTPPEVVGPMGLVEALARPGLPPGWVAVTEDRHTPTSTSPSPSPSPGGATILVGPEGGLTADEVSQARAFGLQPLSLGPWILRTETAVAAALARVLPATGWTVPR